MEIKKIDISARIVYKTIAILLFLWFLYLVREIVMLLFIAVIIVASINPLVERLQRRKIPRAAGVLLIYVILISTLAATLSYLIPNLINQLSEFSQTLSKYFNAEGSFNLSRGFLEGENLNVIIRDIINNFGNSLTNFSENLFSRTVGVFSSLVSVIVVFSLAFYMAMEPDGIKKFVISISPQKNKEYAGLMTERIVNKIGKWMGGQLATMVIVFLLTFIGLTIVGVPYALVLSILAGLLEIVPYIGPIVSAVPGVVLGFFASPATGLLALLVYVVVQQFENHIIVPQVMKKAVGLNPVATIAAILIGFKLAGVLGAIISVPAATAISIFASDFMEKE